MLRSTLAAAALLCFAGLPVQAAPPDHAPPPAPFRKVSELVKLPDFLPGMGTLYVDPSTLPAGPFLAYDHTGRLVSTIYMVPLKDFDSHKKLAGLGATGAPVDHVDMYFNAGHPGVEVPHYHIVLWHVSKAEEIRRRQMMLARRHLLACTSAFATLRFGSVQAQEKVTIRMRSDEDGSHVGFDPVGLLIQPGRTIRFACEANYHTTAAYHPANASHSLRIPREAQPWMSDVLQPGEVFEITLTIPGVYDYFCAPHEAAGMVGRIIVGQPIGPGSLPFDWFKGRTEGKDWISVPAAARTTFPSISDIMRRGTIPATMVGMTHEPAEHK